MGITKLLRQVLLGPPADRGDELHTNDLEGWLDTLAVDTPVATARALAAQLQRVRGQERGLRALVDLLDLLREKAEATLAAVEEQLKRVPLPLPLAQQHACSASEELLKELGGSYLAAAESAPRKGDLLLVCGPLVQKLQSQIERLKKRMQPIKLGLPKNAEYPQYFVMLRSLAVLWGAQPSRRFPRALFHPRVEVVSGFDQLWSFIGQAAFQRRNDDPRTSAAHLPATSTWAVLNESADGFALRHQTGDVAELRVGEIVAIRPWDSAMLHLAAVRRASVETARLELGMQLISSRPTTAMIALPGPGHTDPKLPRLAPVIFLPKLPRTGGAPGLLVKTDTAAVGDEFAVPYQERLTVMRVAGISECYASSDLLLLEPVAEQAEMKTTGEPPARTENGHWQHRGHSLSTHSIPVRS